MTTSRSTADSASVPRARGPVLDCGRTTWQLAHRPAAFVRVARTRAALARVTRRGASALAIAALLAACVDSPNVTALNTTSSSPLADTFDELSRAAGEYGDLARSDGFNFAALAVRSGVTPSRLEVQIGGTVEQYDAFVSSVHWESSVPVALRPPTRRTLIAWRRIATGTTRVLTLTTPSDSAPILSPLALGVGVSTAAVFAGASAMHHDVQDTPSGRPDLSAAFYGTGGWVKLREAAVIRACSDSLRQRGVLGVARCQEARYQVRFDVSMQRLQGRPPTQVIGSVVRRVTSLGETLVSGLKLHFTCATPSGKTGCRP